MKIPERYRRLQEARMIFPFEWDEDGQPTVWPTVFDVYYPPSGFLAIGLFELGNGDMHGFYWPIGHEENEPLLCETYHDYSHVEPHAASLEGLIRIKILRRWYEPHRFEYKMAASIGGQLGVKFPSVNENVAASLLALLDADSESPAILRAAAREAVKSEQFEQAEQYLKKAVEIFPEYTDALFDLAVLYRRIGKLSLAAPRMLEVLSAPCCFGGGRKSCLHWLQRLSNADFPELDNDPLWRHRHNLTLDQGTKTNADFSVYEEAIQEYLRQGKGTLAVRLRILVGELMSMETISFRERSGYSERKHVRLLIENFEQAGLRSRLDTVSAYKR